MSSPQAEWSRKGHPHPPGTDEDRALDQALRRADDLLAASLRAEDHTRRRQRRLYLGGGVAMTVFAVGLAIALYAQSGSGIKPAKLPRPTTTEAEAPRKLATDADRARAQTLAQAGWQLWNAGQFLPASGKFEEALELDPQNADTWNGLGWARFNGQAFAEAEAAFSRALELQPKHPATLNGMGQLNFARRNYVEAEKFLLQAAPQAPAAWYALARLYLLTNQFDKAARWINKIAASGDQDPLLTELKAAAKSRTLSTELRQKIEPPTLTESAGDVAQGWQQLNSGRRDEARATFEAAVNSHPENADAHNGLGWYWLLSNEAQTARPSFERALELQPLHAGALNGLARAHYALDEVDQAVKVWRRMVAEIPGVHAGTVGLAEVYLEREEFGLAVPLWEQLVAAEPANEAWRKKLKLAQQGAGQ